MANRQERETLREETAELGVVTLADEGAGIALEGERRRVAVCAPGGYHWTPARGDTVLVMKCGAEQAPCVVGKTEEQEVSPGEVYLSAVQGAGIRLCGDGRIRLTGRVEVEGTLIVNGQEVGA